MNKLNKMTGAEKTLKWFNDYIKMNGVYPLVAEVEAQLSMAVDEERLTKSENLPISDVSEWVAVDDRLPESRTWVNVCDSDNDVYPMFKDDDKWLTPDNEEPIFDIVYWRSLPEPPCR